MTSNLSVTLISSPINKHREPRLIFYEGDHAWLSLVTLPNLHAIQPKSGQAVPADHFSRNLVEDSTRNRKVEDEWRCNSQQRPVFFRQSLSAAQSKKPLAHLDSSSTHNALSGWLKRNGGFYCGVCVASLESLEPLERGATAVLQTSPTFFIYFLWNIDACYERFKIMCLASSGPATLFSNA